MKDDNDISRELQIIVNEKEISDKRWHTRIGYGNVRSCAYLLWTSIHIFRMEEAEDRGNSSED